MLWKVVIENNFKINLEVLYRFIYIVGYSFVNLKNLEFFGIVCFVEKFLIEEDGILYMGEIYVFDMCVDLVILSSCESGLGKFDKVDGLIGFNCVFVYVGIFNVVFFFWKVYDWVSFIFMVDFYELVLEGENYVISLC